MVCHIHVLNDTHVCTFALDWVPWPKRCHSDRICIFHNGPQSYVQGISDSVQSCDRTRPQRWDPRSHYTRTSHTVALCHPSPEGFHRNHLHTFHTVHLGIHSNPLAVLLIKLTEYLCRITQIAHKLTATDPFGLSDSWYKPRPPSLVPGRRWCDLDKDKVSSRLSCQSVHCHSNLLHNAHNNGQW